MYFGGTPFAASPFGDPGFNPNAFVNVTGSRIKTTATDSFSPVSIVDQEDILLSGKISIGEVLLELP